MSEKGGNRAGRGFDGRGSALARRPADVTSEERRSGTTTRKSCAVRSGYGPKGRPKGAAGFVQGDGEFNTVGVKS